MKTKLIIQTLSISTLMLITSSAYGSMAIPQYGVNEDTKHCAEFFMGDECMSCSLPDGWLKIDEYECPGGYKEVKINSVCTRRKLDHCCTAGHTGGNGDCEDVVVNENNQQCAFVEDINNCESLPSNWKKAETVDFWGTACPSHDYKWLEITLECEESISDENQIEEDNELDQIKNQLNSVKDSLDNNELTSNIASKIDDFYKNLSKKIINLEASEQKDFYDSLLNKINKIKQSKLNNIDQSNARYQIFSDIFDYLILKCEYEILMLNKENKKFRSFKYDCSTNEDCRNSSIEGAINNSYYDYIVANDPNPLQDGCAGIGFDTICKNNKCTSTYLKDSTHKNALSCDNKDEKKCNKDSECTCGYDNHYGNCTIGNIENYSFTGNDVSCNHFCKGINNDLATKCVDNICQQVINEEGYSSLSHNSKSEMIINSTNLDDSDNREEYLDIVLTGNNAINLKTKFAYDNCEDSFTYEINGNNIKITQNLEIDTCLDFFSYSYLDAYIINLENGKYNVLIFYQYDKYSQYISNSKAPGLILSGSFEIK